MSGGYQKCVWKVSDLCGCIGVQKMCLKISKKFWDEKGLWTLQFLGPYIFLTQNLVDQTSFKPSQVRAGPVRTEQLRKVKSGQVMSGQAHLGQVKLYYQVKLV